MVKRTAGRRWRWLVAGLLCAAPVAAPATAADPPRQLVIQAGTKPGEYVVTGAPPTDLPPAAVSPSDRPVLPPGAALPDFPPPGVEPRVGPVVAPVPAGCAPMGKCGGGHCGAHGSFFGEAWAFHKACCKTPATVVPPLGSAVNAMFDAQRLNALAEYFVVYREDWDAGTAFLNPTGERHVDGIIRRVARVPAAVRFEPSGILPLDVRRRAVLVDLLIQSGLRPEEANARVVLGTTRAEGLRNRDIETVYSRHTYGGYGGFGGGYGGFGGGYGGYGGGGVGGYGGAGNYGGFIGR